MGNINLGQREKMSLHKKKKIGGASDAKQWDPCSYSQTRGCLAFCKCARLSVPVSNRGVEGGWGVGGWLSPTQVDMKYCANPPGSKLKHRCVKYLTNE